MTQRSATRARWMAFVGLVVVAGVVAYTLWVSSVRYETPTYEIAERIGNVEIRDYAPYLVAETLVEGDLQTAGSRGFGILAKYIFGANRPAKKIAMTAPVNQEPQRIDMTAPVTQGAQDGKFAIQFMMPSEYSREDLPEPTDERITIREVPERQLAAIRYGGTWSTQNYERNLRALTDTLRSAGYQPMGEPIWARYDPPFKPWFLRRNEILTQFRRTESPE